MGPLARKVPGREAPLRNRQYLRGDTPGPVNLFAPGQGCASDLFIRQGPRREQGFQWGKYQPMIGVGSGEQPHRPNHSTVFAAAFGATVCFRFDA